MLYCYSNINNLKLFNSNIFWKMSDSGDNVKYKWSPESTALLVSVWSDRQVQKQLEYASKPQLIWENVARYMKKKGYNVSGKQCRSRMKQVLVCYREAKRAGTRAGVEQYYESIDKVLKNKRLEENSMNGIDTVDTAINVRSPPKEVKTTKNLQVRYKYQDPVQSFHRTQALSPTWTLTRENEYPDSPESNETVIARPYRVFSPTRDVAINTGEQLIQEVGKSTQHNFLAEEHLHANYKQSFGSNYRYGEIPFQNTVQNVQNQIIQENMQQNQIIQENLQQNPNLQQSCMHNQQNVLVNNLNLPQNLHQGLTTQSIDGLIQVRPGTIQNPRLDHIIQQQNQFQQVAHLNNRAVPQEPTKVPFEHNLTSAYKQQYGNLLTHMPAVVNTKQAESLSPDYSPNVSQNLNDAFCQSKNAEETDNLNETYNKCIQVPNPLTALNSDASVITNNATYNDDSILELLINSPTPSENDNKCKDTAVNTDNIPYVPLRKKKVQKLEQLVLSAINSQNEVVNKILTAQNNMVTKFLDIDRDRQNRLENRLDDLLKVIHVTAQMKQPSELDPGLSSVPPAPVITSLVPPPKPGVAPPKLDLVPPKPCRVPCTMPNSNIELISQNFVATRPGVVSPITSPVKKPGTIWSKLGPVSQSPFVKAQQRLGFQPILNADSRTQSSAERRIAQELDKAMDVRAILYETKKFLEAEKQLEEKIENARIETVISQNLSARKKLFTQREPTTAMILTAAFLENERRASEQLINWYNGPNRIDENLQTIDDNLLAGQGESIERLRHLSIRPPCMLDEPCSTSTPAKSGTVFNNYETSTVVPKQTIQQLKQVVMNTDRWKDTIAQSEQRNSRHLNQSNAQERQEARTATYNKTFTSTQIKIPSRESQIETNENYVQNWISNITNEPKTTYSSLPSTTNQKPNCPIGFTTTLLDTGNLRNKDSNGELGKPIGFNSNNLPDRKQNVRFMDEALAELQRMYIETVYKQQQEMNDSLPYIINNDNVLPLQNQQMIEKYTHDLKQKKQSKDRDNDSDNDDEFLDSTTTMHPVVSRRGSFTSVGTVSTENAHFMKFAKPDNCVIS